MAVSLKVIDSKMAASDKQADKATAERAKALEAALAQIDRAFGKGSAMKLGSKQTMQGEVISTGSLGLDIALGVGGLPRGRVIEIYGPESSGKSWLAALLQERFGGILVGEYVRYFIEQNPRDTCLADIPQIARGQLEWEDQARAKRPELLILDTHLLSNILWSQTLFGACPAWLEPELLARRYDLHLLLSPEHIDWTDDGQRCQPDLEQRLAFFNATRAWLEQHQQSVQIIQGNWAERQTQAFAAVAQLLCE